MDRIDSLVSWLMVCLQDVKLLRYLRKTDQNMPVYFVKMSAEFPWPCCETSISALPGSAHEIVSSPRLLKQLVELEFFSDVGCVSSDGLPSRPPSEVEQALSNTLVPGQYEYDTQLPAISTDCTTAETDAVIVPDLRVTDSHDATDNAYLSTVCQTDVEGEISRLCSETEDPSSVAKDGTCANDAGVNVFTCGSPPTSVGTGADGDRGRPTSTSSSALSVEHYASDVDSETCPLLAESELVDGLTDGFCSGLASFAGTVLQSRLLSAVALMNGVHHRCLETMITVAFDMAWDVICTPKRIKFARTKEVMKTTAFSRGSMIFLPFES